MEPHAPSMQPQPKSQRPPKAHFRTPCRFFLEGRCRKGAACTFLHIAPPAQPPPGMLSLDPAAAAAAAASASLLNLRGTLALQQVREVATAAGLFRTPCRYYAEGYCRAGDACTFIHGAPNLRALAANAAANRPDSRSGLHGGMLPKPPPLPSLLPNGQAAFAAASSWPPPQPQLLQPPPSPAQWAPPLPPDPPPPLPPLPGMPPLPPYPHPAAAAPPPPQEPAWTEMDMIVAGALNVTLEARGAELLERANLGL